MSIGTLASRPTVSRVVLLIVVLMFTLGPTLAVAQSPGDSTPTPVPTGKAPDLNPTLNVGKVRLAGGKIIFKVRFRVFNLGKKPARNVKVSFYLSRDQTLDVTADPLLGSVNLADQGFGKLAKAPGATDTLAVKFKVAPVVGATSGHYLLAVVDPDNTIAETDETNNVAFFGPLP